MSPVSQFPFLWHVDNNDGKCKMESSDMKNVLISAFILLVYWLCPINQQSRSAAITLTLTVKLIQTDWIMFSSQVKKQTNKQKTALLKECSQCIFFS